ncbi:MAG TPA: hypothetical protein VIC85_16035 [Ktedonobacterales bacterium]
MPSRGSSLMRWGRSRWALSMFSALTAVVLIVGFSMGARLSHAGKASPTVTRPPWADKFDDDSDLGRLDQSFLAEYAYPNTDVPFQATLNAQSAFQQVASRGQSKHAAGSWSLIGPSTAIQPGVLSFTGNQYITSGRVTALAIAPTCTASQCRLWVGAAGGGVWRTDNALSGTPGWTFLSGSFGTNAIGTLTVDPTDPSGNTIYAGTGEPNASADSEAGLGIYKSTDGGTTWTHLASQVTALTTAGNGTYTGDAFAARSISTIVVDPTNANTLYVSSTRGIRGGSSVTSGGATTSPPTPRPPFGLFKSTDGGATFSFIWDGNGTIRGVNQVALDPSSVHTVYAAAFQQGIWRSTDDGATWAQIFTPTSPLENTDRSQFAVTTKSGLTRMYVGDGSTGVNPSQVFRTDDAQAASPAFVSLTSSSRLDPRYGTFNYCTGQCWYDNGIYTPAGQPDTVVVIGSYQYSEIGLRSNGRAVTMSKDAGATFSDLTMDASSNTTPNGLHPDQHALVFMPGNPDVWFEGSDGGMVRSSGSYSDISAQCDSRPLSPPSLVACHNLLKAVPSHLYFLNKGLSTLQFQSLSASASDPTTNLMGGTQDNGTWQYSGSSVTWNQAIYGDGGQSGFSAGNSALRFNTFTGQATDVNFQNGDPTKWVIGTGPIAASGEGAYFYPPVVADPNSANAGTIFQGSQSVWRTQDWAGSQAYLEANCPEFTTAFNDPACGDFVRIGPSGATNLTAGSLGTRAGGDVAAITRAPSNTGTLWVATGTGRVFVSENSDAAANAVTFTRIDTLASNAPGRFVSSIYVDPSNPNHAWISYSGYNFNTPSQPGHVFEVTYNPLAGTATWVNLDGGTGPMGDLPVTGLVRDDVTGDLYASTDFGVMTLPNASSSWALAGVGMPNVEVDGLTIVPGSRVLYAATHGRSAWKLNLA